MVPQRRDARDRAPVATVEESSDRAVDGGRPQGAGEAWNSAPRNWSLVDGEDVHEYYCTDNPDVDEFQKLVDQGK
jgi:hypothetical protein